MNIRALIEEARGPEDAAPFAEPMFLDRFATLVRAQALEEAARVCEKLIPDADEQCEYEASAWLHSALDAIRALAKTPG